MLAISHFITIRHFVFTMGIFSIVLNSGCTTTTVSPSPVAINIEADTPPLPSNWIPVARYGRYTLVELTPQVSQHNLLLQVVDVSMPATPHAMVGDGLRHVLQRSGYALCDGDPQVAALYELPLPAAHLQLGPMFLHDALLTLAGPAWELQVDDRTRQVCFTPRQETSP